MDIFILDRSYNKIGTLSNQGVRPQAPYFDDLYTQELETGADTYCFSTTSSPFTQDIIEIGNYIMFSYKNRSEVFAISSIEYYHGEGNKNINVYAEGIGFELLEVFMEKPTTDDSEDDSNTGNDSDGDGDDNTDDEYGDPDDVYIDENGNIIYNTGDDDSGSSADDVTIDGDGNIIYKPNSEKDENKSDALEFTNISYPTFLGIILKNTDWTYVAEPGLESVKNDINVSYNKNIYAILQDSMQAYEGVELEFVHEYNNGSIKKIVKAYKNGGRGSFVGKRFEYGINVKGITKTQKITTYEDENVIFNEGLVEVNGMPVEISYDVDFALRSHEVEELEIGDTHYVIDNDFYPPLQIEARIGKIEISFSDLTKNKVYLANFKKITGSVSDSTNVDDIEDIVEDIVGEHDHDRLVYENSPMYYRWVTEENTILANNVNYKINSNTVSLETEFMDMSIRAYEKYPDVYTAGEFTWIDFKIKSWGENQYETTVFTSDTDLIPGRARLIGSEDTPWNKGNFLNLNVYDTYSTFIRSKYSYTTFHSPIYIQSDAYNVRSDENSMININQITDSSSITKQDILDFVLNEINIYSFIDKTLDEAYKEIDGVDQGAYLGILNRDFVENNSSDDCGTWTSESEEIAPLIMRRYKVIQSGNNNSQVITPWHDYNLSALVTALIAAFQQYVENGGTELDLSEYATLDYVNTNYLSASNASTTYATKTYVDTNYLSTSNASTTYATKSYVDEAIDSIDISEIDLTDYATISYVDEAINTIDLDSYITEEDATATFASKNDLKNYITVEDAGATFVPKSTLEDYATKSYVDEAINDITPSSTFDTITVTKIQGPDPGEGQYNYVEFEDAIRVTHIWGNEETGIVDFGADTYVSMHNGLDIFGDLEVDGLISTSGDIECGGTVIQYSDKSLKENIRYIDDSVMTVNDTLLEKADLYDFIVNQVKLCEFNFIGNDSDKIGFIANDYEGTKVGDKIVSKRRETLVYDSSNLLFATIGALQEEVRIRDEKIVSLEARLAAIETMLGINNN